MTQQRTASTAALRNRIEGKHNVTLMPVNDPNTIQYYSNGRNITLSPSIIRQYLVAGSGNVTDQEIMMFLQLCHFQGLNPFLREAYCVKYGNSPAAIIVGKETFTKRAERHPDFRGLEAGIWVLKKDGEAVKRNGSFSLPNETVVGGWARVHRANRTITTDAEVSFDEYVGRKGDGTINAQWSGKPNTMIRKVAVVQALREAFPEELGGMYSEEEFSHIQEDDLPREVIETPFNVVVQSPEQPQRQEVGQEQQEQQEQPQGQEEPQMLDLICGGCESKVTAKVAEFSQKKFNATLCMSCQKQQ